MSLSWLTIGASSDASRTRSCLKRSSRSLVSWSSRKMRGTFATATRTGRSGAPAAGEGPARQKDSANAKAGIAADKNVIRFIRSDPFQQGPSRPDGKSFHGGGLSRISEHERDDPGIVVPGAAD